MLQIQAMRTSTRFDVTRVTQVTAVAELKKEKVLEDKFQFVT